MQNIVITAILLYNCIKMLDLKGKFKMADKKYAYTTILSTDSYLPGVLALFESIKRTNTKISDFVVIVNQEIKKKQ